MQDSTVQDKYNPKALRRRRIEHPDDRFHASGLQSIQGSLMRQHQVGTTSSELAEAVVGATFAQKHTGLGLQACSEKHIKDLCWSWHP